MEQLQKQLSSVMSKNEDYRQLNLDKDQQRDRDKVRYILSETLLLIMNSNIAGYRKTLKTF